MASGNPILLAGRFGDSAKPELWTLEAEGLAIEVDVDGDAETADRAFASVGRQIVVVVDGLAFTQSGIADSVGRRRTISAERPLV